MSDDENIARAIALSLQDPSFGNSRSTNRIDTSATANDSDEEAQFQADLQRALEASREETPRTRPVASRAASSVASSSRHTPQTSTQTREESSSASSFLSERAQLERARLERQKRLRGDTEQEGDGANSSGYAGEPPRKRLNTTNSPRSSREESQPSTSSYNTPPVARARLGTEKAAEGGVFWDGEVRQTANKHVEKGKNGEDGKPVWRLSEIIGDKSQLSLAIISTYAHDVQWIYQFFDHSTPVVLVTQPSQSDNGNPTVKQILPNWIRVTPFLRGGRGVVHMKFFLLFYKSGRLRIGISTANLVDFDWRDIENTIWVQDVPRRPSPIPHDPKASDFPATFEFVLKALNISPALISFVHNDHPTIPLASTHPGTLRTIWDFSRIRAKLVPSIAGKHEGWPNVIKTGHMALMKSVREIGADACRPRRVVIEYQGSSIGTYTTQWLNEFYGSASGESPEKWLDEPKSKRTKLPWPRVSILFPTAEWVRRSVLGERGGGTMFCRRSQWEGAKFPRELFRQSRSKRGRVLMHSKMIIATFEESGASGEASDSDTETESDDDIEVVDEKGKEMKRVLGWTYVGSHNFTASAWGTLSGSGFTPILNVTNYELGIVLPLHSESEIERMSCFERPPKKYSSRDLPWMQDESTVFNDG